MCLRGLRLANRLYFRLACLYLVVVLTVVRFWTSILALPWKKPREYSLSEIVLGDGYPYQRYSIVTEDGYIVQLDRLVREDTTRAVFLQHGIMDNSWAFFPTEPGKTCLAYELYNLGYDVFLGNGRGTASEGKSEHLLLDDEAYWNYSVNELAMYDFPAFLAKIHALKPKCSLTVVAHSLGGATALMYLVFAKLGLSVHHSCDSVIVLSPAGIHQNNTLLMSFILRLIQITLYMLPPHVIRTPDMLTNLMNSIWKDAKRIPFFRRIVEMYASFLVGGQSVNHPVHHVKSENIFAWPSVQVARHMIQMWQSRCFQSFDHGRHGNLRAYGNESPIGILDYYHLLDVPIHFVAGEDDLLILQDNVQVHYDTLQQNRPHLAHFHTIGCNHLEFTVGMGKDSTMTSLLKIITSV